MEYGREGETWRRERKEGRERDGINLPHGRLKTLAALEQEHKSYRLYDICDYTKLYTTNSTKHFE